MPGYTSIDLTVSAGVGVLTLDRPEVRNAVDDVMRAELSTAIEQIESDLSIRALILTGAGTAFCAGGDIRGMQERIEQGDRASELGWRRQRSFHHTITRLHELDRPTIAAVNGAAFGLGLDLALACDFIHVAPHAVLSESFVHRALIPDGGALFHLPRRIGLARAKELIFTGRRVDAWEAERIGLVDRVAEGDVLEEARVFAAELAAGPGLALALAKTILNRSSELSLSEVNALGSQAQAVCYSTPDHRDSVREFLAKRTERSRES